jgi:hypothetical protein
MADDPRVCFFVDGAVVSASARRWSIDAVAAASIDDRVRRAVETAIRGMYPYVPELDVALRRPETSGELERADSRFILEWLRCLGEEKGQACSLSALEALALSVRDGALVSESAGRPGQHFGRTSPLPEPRNTLPFPNGDFPGGMRTARLPKRPCPWAG